MLGWQKEEAIHGNPVYFAVAVGQGLTMIHFSKLSSAQFSIFFPYSHPPKDDINVFREKNINFALYFNVSNI